MVTPSRDSVVAELRALRAGLEKNRSADSVNIGGRTYSVSDLIARIDVSLKADADLVMARAALTGALTHQRAIQAGEAVFLAAVWALVKLKYSGLHDKLVDFGLEPKQRQAARTNEQRLVMSAKNRATRTKRGTMSKSRKATIHGDVTGVVITPVKRGREPPK